MYSTYNIIIIYARLGQVGVYVLPITLLLYMQVLWTGRCVCSTYNIIIIYARLWTSRCICSTYNIIIIYASALDR